ncbi:MAG: CBS domain-containing protein [Oscillospiraceae bacterium]|nr:CBS domain-containing protein [Oscillospiraceae bacterium]
MSHNVLFFLTPKAMCQFLYDDYTIRQALEKMESSGYSALPILNRQGEYRGTLSDGDVLWAMKNLCDMDLQVARSKRITEISRRKDNVPIRVTHSMRDLVARATEQNFVPVVDDKDTFIGLVTRKAIISYCIERLFPED